MDTFKIPPIEINVGPRLEIMTAYMQWLRSKPFDYDGTKIPTSFTPEHFFQLWLMVAFVAGYQAGAEESEAYTV